MVLYAVHDLQDSCSSYLIPQECYDGKIWAVLKPCLFQTSCTPWNRPTTGLYQHFESMLILNSMIKCKKPYITDPECMEHLSWGGAEGSKDLLTCAHCLPSEWGQERPHWVMSTKPHRDTSTLNPAYHEASLGTKTRFVSLPPPPYNLHLGRSLLEPPARWTCLNF